MIDEINELPEDGLRSLLETSQKCIFLVEKLNKLQFLDLINTYNGTIKIRLIDIKPKHIY